MTIGSIVSIAHNEVDQRKINFAVQQLLQRNGGQQVNSVVTTTSDYTARDSDFLILISGDSNFSPTSASAAPGQLFCVKKTDSSATTATIDNGINTTDGSTAVTLTSSGQVVMIESDGTQYQSLIHTTAVDLSVVLHTTNALSELSTNAAAARSNLGLGGLSTAGSSTVLQTANSLSEISTSAATARSNISAAAKTQNLSWSYAIANALSNETIDLVESVPYSCTISSITLRNRGGTVNLNFQINGVSITGASSVSATTAKQVVTPSGANTCSSGDVVTVITSSISAFTGIFLTIHHSASLA